MATGSKAAEELELNPQPQTQNPLSKGKSNTPDSKPAIEVATGFGIELSVFSTAKAEVYPLPMRAVRKAIELGLSRGRNAMAIWQDLVDQGFGGAYRSVKRFVRKLCGNQPVEARGDFPTV